MLSAKIHRFKNAATFLMLFITGCKSTDAVLLQACSHDENHCATVVFHKGQGSLSSDFYIVYLKDVHKWYVWSHWANGGFGAQVLNTTTKAPTRLVWLDDQHLEIICKECHLLPGDAFNEKEVSGTVHISYIGFPASIN